MNVHYLLQYYISNIHISKSSTVECFKQYLWALSPAFLEYVSFSSGSYTSSLYIAYIECTTPNYHLS